MADAGYEYVALQPITWNGVLAYNPGDLVPAANVDAQGYEVGVQVAQRDSVPEPPPQDATAPTEDL